jgi:hypothetical protein
LRPRQCAVSYGADPERGTRVAGGRCPRPALATLLLARWGLRPARAGWRRVATSATACGLGLVALWNGVMFYRVWELGKIEPWMPLPHSFLLAATIFLVAVVAARPAQERAGRSSLLLVVAALLLCGVLFTLGQQVFFDKTTYLRPAQAAVVFGAEVHRSGVPSISLVGRVRTAAELYKAGRARQLLLSGGQGAGEPVNETTAMRSLAIAFGVPAATLQLDPRGRTRMPRCATRWRCCAARAFVAWRW